MSTPLLTKWCFRPDENDAASEPDSSDLSNYQPEYRNSVTPSTPAETNFFPQSSNNFNFPEDEPVEQGYYSPTQQQNRINFGVSPTVIVSQVLIQWDP